MKTTYKILLTAISSTIFLSANAQNTATKDTTMNRQILLEREYNPTLQDASKINTLPAIHEPIIKNANIQYETKHPNMVIQAFPVGDTGAGDINTNIDFSKKRGYLTLGAGNYSNIISSLGYKIIDSENDQLDVFVRHYSTNGNIKYADKEFGLDKVKAKYMNSLVKAKYLHNFEYLKWYLTANYQNTNFNYYGNPFGSENYNFDKKQALNTFGVETGIQSNDNNEFIYDGFISFNNFSTKVGPTIEEKGPKGNIINAKLDIATPMGSDNLIGIRLGIINQNFSDIKYVTNKDLMFHNFTKLQFNPYYKVEGDNFLASLGVNINYAIDNKNKLAIAPDINLSWQFADKTSFYLNTTGGINNNDFLSIMQENRYVSLSEEKVRYSHTIIDGSLGIKSGIAEGFEFDIFAGYKHTKDEHLYVRYKLPISYGSHVFGNTTAPDYYNLGTGHFGGLIKTTLIPYTDLSAKAVVYFYDVKSKTEDLDIDYKAWNLPTFTFNLRADITPINNLTISASYNLATGRKTLLKDQVKSMKNISELNFRGEYRFTDWLSAFAQVNNALNQKYDTWYGYTHQGFNVMGGVSLKF